MKCPHCTTEIHNASQVHDVGGDQENYWMLGQQHCPACGKIILELIAKQAIKNTNGFPLKGKETVRYFAVPRVTTRPRPPIEVPPEFAQDYIEAALVLIDSPKASAALSRRCLQHILREKAGIKRPDLAKEIDEVIASGKLPSHLAEAIDAIRNIGNFAAHPIKSTASGEILPVEPGEAEWNLDVLDGLFDFYFVQPEILKKKRAALNAKLASANKPPIK